jgi:hypothetical protein
VNFAPWGVSEAGFDYVRNGVAVFADRLEVAWVHRQGSVFQDKASKDQTVAIARRIVACVNFMASMGTDCLEKMVGDGETFDSAMAAEFEAGRVGYG